MKELVISKTPSREERRNRIDELFHELLRQAEELGYEGGFSDGYTAGEQYILEQARIADDR